jgi:hypothetical protein
VPEELVRVSCSAIVRVDWIRELRRLAQQVPIVLRDGKQVIPRLSYADRFEGL